MNVSQAATKGSNVIFALRILERLKSCRRTVIIWWTKFTYSSLKSGSTTKLSIAILVNAHS